MHTLVLPVSRGCPNACLFCNVADQLDGARVPAASIKEAIDRGLADGIERLVLTGGEPLLGRHVLRAIAYAHGHGLRTEVSTSGRLLSDPQIIGRLEAAGLDGVNVALHAVDADTHTRLTGDVAAHPQTMEGLRLAAASSMHTTLRVVLTALNVDALPDLVALAAELGVAMDVRVVAFEGRARDGAGLAPGVPEAQRAIVDGLNRAEASGVPFTFSGLPSLSRLNWPATGAAPAVDDAAHRALVDAGVWDAPLRRGLPEVLRARRPEPDAVLRARGLPVPRPARSPAISTERAVHVVADLAPDDVLASASGLMGLALALEKRGLVVGRHTAWRGAETEDGLPVDPGRKELFPKLRRDRRPVVPWQVPDVDLATACRTLVEGMTLAGAGTILVRGLRMAALVRQQPRLPKQARLVVLDADPRDSTPFEPGPHDLLVTPLPMLLDRWPDRGVPLEQVLSWAPLVDPRPLPSAAPDDLAIVLGGPCLDAGLARTLLDVLPATHRVLGPAPDDLGLALPEDPREALAVMSRASWLVVPHLDAEPDPWTMAWLMRAAVLGLPIVGTATAAVDAVYPPGSGRVVRPGDLTGLRIAVERTAQEGYAAWKAAREALAPMRRLASPDRLAQVLLEGARAETDVKGPVGPW